MTAGAAFCHNRGMDTPHASRSALVLLSLLAWRILYKRKKPAPQPQEAVYEIV